MKNAMLMVNFSRNSATYFLSENLYNISQRLILDINKNSITYSNFTYSLLLAIVIPAISKLSTFSKSAHFARGNY